MAAGEREGDRTVLQHFPAVEKEFMQLQSNPTEMGWGALENREAMHQKYRITEMRPGQVQQESKRTAINISLLILLISNTLNCHQYYVR